jgi:lipopolysaccharide/colanic/teichoic acid biosynthesis glycosyltransferase
MRTDGERRTSRAAFVPRPRFRARFSDALPRNEFLRDLQREQRRAERCQAALSLAIYRVGVATAQDAEDADRLLEALHGAKRETDILGHVDDDLIAVLCPDTDEQGIQGFMRKIEGVANGLPFLGIAATYPDDFFDNLANGTRTQPALEPFLVADNVEDRPVGYALKRYLDVAGALLALCLLAPLMLIVAAVIWCTSAGPVIFRQTRLGKAGIPFTFYKFRSMVANADDGIHREFVEKLIKGVQTGDEAARDAAAPYKLHADPRVTRVGRFIRKTSIDELPQLFNVLKGDMSLVGPRPPLPYEAAQYQSWHLRRVLAIKPGITGLWQVEGRSKVTFDEMVRMDLRYLRESSLMLDIKLLLKTVLVVLRCQGAV